MQEFTALSSGIIALLFLLIGYRLWVKRNKSSFLYFSISLLALSSILILIRDLYIPIVIYLAAPDFIQIIAIIAWLAFYALLFKKISEKKAPVEYSDAVDASKLQRILNYLIDSSILFLTINELINLSTISSYLMAVIFCIAYYTIFEFMGGFTLGKLMTGTRVISNNDSPLKLKQILIRSLIRSIPVDAFTFFSKTPGWHDAWTDTKVIKTEKTFNKWYHYVLPAPVAFALVVSFLILDTYVDEPARKITSENQIDDELHTKLSELQSNWHQLDSSMVISFLCYEEVADKSSDDHFYSTEPRQADIRFYIEGVSDDSLYFKHGYILPKTEALSNQGETEQLKDSTEVSDSTHVSFNTLSVAKSELKDITSLRNILFENYLKGVFKEEEFKIANIIFDYTFFGFMPQFSCREAIDEDVFKGHLSGDLYYEITNVNCKQGTFKVSSDFPLKPSVNYDDFSQHNILSLKTEGFNPDEEILLAITFKNQLDMEKTIDYRFWKGRDQYTGEESMVLDPLFWN